MAILLRAFSYFCQVKDGNYSIKDLEHHSSVKAHTIRIWEKRYGLLTPKRTDTNIRYYDDSDLKKLLNIQLLNQSGLKISKIAQLSDEQLEQSAKELIMDQSVQEDAYLNRLINGIIEFDKNEIEEILEYHFQNVGLQIMFETIIIKLMQKIGQLWQVNSIKIVHEHFFSHIFKQFINQKINGLVEREESNKKAILFLPEHEQHEFAVLIIQHLLTKNGIKCYYFGANIPIQELLEANEVINADFIFTSFTSIVDKKTIESILEELVKTKASKIIIGGSQILINQPEIPDGIINLSSFSQLLSEIK